MADSDAERKRRSRLHLQGDHSLCRHPEQGPDSLLMEAVREEFPADDPLCRELAIRFAELATIGNGPTAVAATTKLAEWVAEMRASRQYNPPRPIVQ